MVGRVAVSDLEEGCSVLSHVGSFVPITRDKQLSPLLLV
jgi:hypothetical protein